MLNIKNYNRERINSLPRWAREYVIHLEQRNEELRNRIDTLENKLLEKEAKSIAEGTESEQVVTNTFINRSGLKNEIPLPNDSDILFKTDKELNKCISVKIIRDSKSIKIHGSDLLQINLCSANVCEIKIKD